MFDRIPKNTVIGMALIFLLGISFAVVNGWYTSDTNQQLPFIVYGISFISIIVGALTVLSFQWKLSKIQEARILRFLPYEERIIMKILLENNGSLEQNKIVVLSGLKKVKVSRILSKLESRGVVKKHDLGNTNYVRLTV